MRILGLDHGTKRIGVALSDALGLTASPLLILPADGNAARAIADLVKARQVVGVALGRPLTMDGRDGEAVARVEKFAGQLRQALPPSVSVRWVDERLSTVSATEIAGKNRARVDDLAAAVILQDFLDAQNGPAPLPNPDGFP